MNNLSISRLINNYSLTHIHRPFVHQPSHRTICESAFHSSTIIHQSLHQQFVHQPSRYVFIYHHTSVTPSTKTFLINNYTSAGLIDKLSIYNYTSVTPSTKPFPINNHIHQQLYISRPHQQLVHQPSLTPSTKPFPINNHIHQQL